MPLRSIISLPVLSFLCCVFVATQPIMPVPASEFDIRIEPGGSPEDTKTAQDRPDEYAWKLFFFLNRQAAPGTAGKPDLNKRDLNNYEADMPVVWETWALSSGEDFSEAFPCGGIAPQDWDKLARKDKIKPQLGEDPTTGKQRSPNDTGSAIPISIRSLPHPPGLDDEEEVRMNKANYQTIQDQELWNQEGIQASVLQAKKCGKPSFVTFPQDAKEIKAAWVHLTDCDLPPNAKCNAEKSHFHWRTITSLGQPEVWGLAALHLITKDIQPNWFWADFIQADCLSNFPGHGPSTKICPLSGHERDAFVQNPVDSSIYSAGITSDSPGNNKWHYYRLMGTETGFESPLSDPIIEISTVKSSCITCHAYAATTASFLVPSLSSPLPNPLPHPLNAAIPLNGSPDEKRFLMPPSGALPAQRLYFGSDFEWSMLQHAKSIKSACVLTLPESEAVPRHVHQPSPCTNP